MKRLILSQLACFFALIAWASGGERNGIVSWQNQHSATRISTVDMADSMNFDLLNATVVGNHFSVPFYIATDDTVFALDFNLKYDRFKLRYDSISNYTSNSLYVVNDDTVSVNRLFFTCFSMSSTAYASHVSLFRLHFTLLGAPPVIQTDFDSVATLLNGNVCSNNLFPLPSAVHGAEAEPSFEMYPNPVTGTSFNLELQGPSGISVINCLGRVVYRSHTAAASKVTIGTTAFPAGVYTVVVEEGNTVWSRKLIVP